MVRQCINEKTFTTRHANNRIYSVLRIVRKASIVAHALSRFAALSVMALRAVKTMYRKSLIFFL